MTKVRSGAIATLLVLGTSVAPAYAAAVQKHQSSSTQIILGSYKTSAASFVAKDGKSETTFIPVWYVIQGLKANGFQVTWNGQKGTLHIEAPNGMPVDLKKLPPGHRSSGIYLNGLFVQPFTPRILKDPASGVSTAYIPVWYIQNALKRVNLNSTWSRHVLSLTPSSTYPVILSNNTKYGPVSGNHEVSKNVLILGTNTTLRNTVINGDVYVNPGADGEVTLSGIKVNGKIYVESGATHSVHLDNVTADVLAVNSSSPVHIVSTGNTNIQETQVTSADKQPVMFENNGGTLGSLYIQSGQSIVLSGSVPYTSITVESGASVTIAAGAQVMNLTVDSSGANVTVASGASVDAVNVQSGSNLHLTVNGTVNTLNNESTATVALSGSGTVSKTTGTGVSGSTTGSGGSSTGPSASGGSSGTTTGSSGGSSGNGGSSGSGSNSSGGTSNSGGGDTSGGGTSSTTTVGRAPNGSTLAKPTNLASNGSRITWNPVADSTGYEILVQGANGQQVLDLNTGSGLGAAATGENLSNYGLPSGQYTVQVKATAKDSSYQASDLTVSQSVYVYQLPTPTNLQVTGNVATWNRVPLADAYNVSVFQGNSQQFVTSEQVTTNSFDLSKAGLPTGTYRLAVSATDSKDNFGSSEPTLKSSAVNVTDGQSNVTPLSQPVNVAVYGTVVKWSPVAHAEGYEIDWEQISGGPTLNMGGIGMDTQGLTTDPNTGLVSYDLAIAAFDQGTYTIKVKATATGQYADSAYSQPQTAQFNQLSAPEQVTMTGTTISWQPVQHATGYVVNLARTDGVYFPAHVTESSTTMSLSDIDVSGLTAGTYAITISAVGSGYVNSLGATAGSITVGQPTNLSNSAVSAANSSLNTTSSSVTTGGQITYTLTLNDGNGHPLSGVSGDITPWADSTNTTFGSVTESTAHPGTYTFTATDSMAETLNAFVTVVDPTNSAPVTVAANSVTVAPDPSSHVTTIQDSMTDDGRYVTDISSTSSPNVVSVVYGTTSSQLTGAIQTTDGSAETYAIQDANGQPVTGTLAAGDVLLVTAADGTDHNQYDISVDPSSDTVFNSVYEVSMADNVVTIVYGTTAESLAASIQASDGSIQTYAITDQNGQVVSGPLADGDVLTVTAADGTEARYSITMALA